VIEIRPIVQATGPNNPSKQISVDNWNLGHALTAAPLKLIGTDAGGLGREYNIGGPGGILDEAAGDLRYVNVAGDTMTGALTVVGLSSTQYVAANGGLVARGGPVEGGQIIIGYVGKTDIIGQASGSWNIDVDDANDMRIFRINALGEALVALGIDEVTGLVTAATGLATGGNLDVSGGIQGHGGVILVDAAPGGAAYFTMRTSAGETRGYTALGSDGATVYHYATGNHVFRSGSDTPIATISPAGVSVPDEAYGPAWNGNLSVPTKNSLWAKIQALGAPVWGTITGILSNQTDLQAALDGKSNVGHTHVIADTTGLQAALDSKVDDSEMGAYATDAELAASLANYIPLTQKGAPGGVPPLDGGGKVSATYLPSYVDDVLEFANLAAFPATGETGKIYIAIDTGYQYRWSGSAYVQLSAAAGGAVWGAITGTLSAQTDLQTGLDAKAALAGATFTGEVVTSAALSVAATLQLRGTPIIFKDTTNATIWGRVITSATDIYYRFPKHNYQNYNGTVTYMALNDTVAAFAVPVTVPDDAYSASWNGSLQAPTKNAVYDKIEAVTAGGGGVTTFNTRSGAVTLNAADVSAAGANAFVATGAISGSNLSGTNTGDQTTIVGITGTKAQFDTAVTDDNFAYIGQANSFTAAQTITAGLSVASTATAITLTPTTANLNLGTSLSTGQVLIGGVGSTGTISVGLSTVTQAVHVAASSTASGSTKTINLGTGGLAGSTTNINIGSAASATTVAVGGPLTVPDDAYAVGWNGSLAVPTKNAVYDKIELLATDIAGKATVSQLANYLPLTGGTVSGPLTASAGVTVTSGGVNADTLSVSGPTGAIYFQDRDGAGQPWLAYNNADVFRLYGNGADRLTLAANGDLGVGGRLYAQHVEAYGEIISKGSLGTFAGANMAAGIESRAVNGATDGAWHAFHRPGAMAMHIGLDADGWFKMGGWSWNYSPPAFQLSQNGDLKLAGSSVEMSSTGQCEIRCGPGASSGIMYMSNTNAGWYKAGGNHTYSEMAAGGAFNHSGPIISEGKRVFRHNDGAFGSSNIFISTAAPSGGADGDIWLQYT
jgi:hypothetical protein